MNICFLAHLPIIPYVGGIQRVTTILSREFSRRGHSVTYLCYDASCKGMIENHEIEYPQYFIDIYADDASDLLHSFVKKNEIDCIISQAQDKKSIMLLRMLPSFVKVISVHHTMPFPFHTPSRKQIWREFPSFSLKILIYKLAILLFPSIYVKYAIKKECKLYYETLESTDRFVYLTESSFPRILRFMPDFPREKLVAINNPNTFDVIDTPRFVSKKNIMLWVGRVDHNKNCLDFIKAWRLFSVKYPDWSAIIAGDGSELQKCISWSKANKVTNLTFLGYCNDVAKLYRNAKIFVSTSFSEGWSMVLCEALSMGCIPCVYNTFDALNDIVKDGVNGLLSNPNYTDLYNKLVTLVSDQEKMEQISVNTVESVARFSVTKICDQWENLLNNIEK